MRYNVVMIGRSDIHHSAMLQPELIKRKVIKPKPKRKSGEVPK